jgi:hypothetical protein
MDQGNEAEQRPTDSAQLASQLSKVAVFNDCARIAAPEEAAQLPDTDETLQAQGTRGHPTAGEHTFVVLAAWEQ